MTWSTTRTWTAGDDVTASRLNAEIRDNLREISGYWTSYTPAWTQFTTNPTLGNGELNGSYTRFGQTIRFQIRLVIGSTTTLGTGIWDFSLPVSAYRLGPAFPARCWDSSASFRYPAFAEIFADTGHVRCRTWPNTAGAASASVTQTQPFAWAAGDVFFFSGVYETDDIQLDPT